ncbi:MAG: glycosyltransferase family 39 protein [Acidobacteriota bacterium]
MRKIVFRAPSGPWFYLLLAVLVFAAASVCLMLFGPLTGDSARYLRLAGNLASGQGFSAATEPPYYPEVFRAPLYPLFLSILLRFGLGILAIIILQVALYLSATIIAGKIALVLTGNRMVAAVSSLMLAGYLPLVHWVAAITTESLCTALFCLCCWLFLTFIKTPSWKRVVLLGLTLVALFLTRTTYIVVFPLVIGFSFLLFHKRKTIAYSAVLTLLICLPAGAWIFRNLAVIPGGSSPFGVGSGMALFVGSVEVQEPDIGKRNWIMDYPDFVVVHGGAEPASIVAADQQLRREAMSIIRARWADYLKRTALLVAFRQWVEVYDPHLPGLVLWAVTGISSAMLILAYSGILMTINRWRMTLPLVLLSFSVATAHAIFANEARYTAPVRPVLYVFSAIAICRVIEWAIQLKATRSSQVVMERAASVAPQKDSV